LKNAEHIDSYYDAGGLDTDKAVDDYESEGYSELYADDEFTAEI